MRGTLVAIAVFAGSCSILFSPDNPGGDGIGEGLDCEFVQVAPGEHFTCALRRDGVVLCWGSNEDGQLGVGDERHDATPKRVPMPAAIQIATGEDHACALGEDRQLRCWGQNTQGQLGNGNNTSQATPVPVAGDHTWIQVAVGDNFTCAIEAADSESEQTLRCWGSGANGRLGDGTLMNKPMPTPLALQGVVEVRAGEQTACARLDDGAVFCWGDNSNLAAGQVGGGNIPSPEPVELGGPASALAIWNHACAIVEGDIKCWGDNGHGELGSPGGDSSVPLTVPVGDDAIGIAVGESHTCAVFEGGDVRCWGANNFGQLADSVLEMERGPGSSIGSLQGQLVRIAAGTEHTCGVTTAGRIKCWGSSVAGEAGDGPELLRAPTPVNLGGGAEPKAIAAGEKNTCAITTVNAIYCWGLNDAGQLGTEGEIASSTPRLVGVPFSPVTTPSDIDVGDEFACAVNNEDSKIYCWGRGNDGRLGTGSTTTTHIPTAVAGTELYASVSLGEDFACGISTSGNAFCWGNNNTGQVGNAAALDGAQNMPMAVDSNPWGNASVSDISAGTAHACAAIGSEGVHCWGDNRSGQLGDGTQSAGSATPVVVADPPIVASKVAAGKSHSCATGTDGTVCWGAGSRGQLGNGNNGPSTVPVPVTGIGQLEVVSAGDLHVCGMPSGKGVCWGDNTQLQVSSDGDSTPVTTPFDLGIDGVDTFIDISSGREHTCAIASTGDAGDQVYCWGSDRFGMAGSGRPLQIAEPTEPAGLDVCPQ